MAIIAGSRILLTQPLLCGWIGKGTVLHVFQNTIKFRPDWSSEECEAAISSIKQIPDDDQPDAYPYGFGECEFAYRRGVQQALWMVFKSGCDIQKCAKEAGIMRHDRKEYPQYMDTLLARVSERSA